MMPDNVYSSDAVSCAETTTVIIVVVVVAGLVFIVLIVVVGLVYGYIRKQRVRYFSAS